VICARLTSGLATCMGLDSNPCPYRTPRAICLVVGCRPPVKSRASPGALWFCTELLESRVSSDTKGHRTAPTCYYLLLPSTTIIAQGHLYVKFYTLPTTFRAARISRIWAAAFLRRSLARTLAAMQLRSIDAFRASSAASVCWACA